MSGPMYRDQACQTLTISIGGTVNNEEIELKHYVLFGLELPAGFTGTSLSFQVARAKSADGGTYQPLIRWAKTGVMFQDLKREVAEMAKKR